MKQSVAGLAWIGLVATGFGLVPFAWADGAWTPDGVKVTNAADYQSSPRVAADGAGGIFVAWSNGDTTTGFTHARMQRFNANGVAQWTTDGVVISSGGTGGGEYPVSLLPDGAGGVVAFLQYIASGLSYVDIYAQRVDGDGTLHWPLDSKPITVAPNAQENSQTVADGAAGFITVWQDQRGAFNDDNIYAQRIDADGNALWTLNGQAVSLAPNVQEYPQLASDSAGGVFIVWEDTRNSGLGAYDVYAQHLDASGNALWVADGIPICTGYFNFWAAPQIVGDGAGGAIIAWIDARVDLIHSDIRAQRVDANGNTLWAQNGIPVCAAGGSGGCNRLQMLPDPAGAFLAWEDARNANTDLYMQRLDRTGAGVWAANGVPLCVAPNSQAKFSLTRDATGDIVAAWEDQRNGSATDLYAQRVRPDGSLVWGNGVALCLAANNQSQAVLAFSGAGGGIAAWTDAREGIMYFNSRIFAQKIIRPWPLITGLAPASGPRGKILANLSATGQFFQDDQGQVTYLTLTRTGQADISAANLSVTGPTGAHADFDLTSAAVGPWQVVAYDSLGQTSAASAAATLSVFQPQMQSLDWISAPGANVFTGSRDNLFGQINCTAAGFDVFTGLTVQNLATGTSADLDRLSLWRLPGGRSSGITFDSQLAQRLGNFSPTGNNKIWTLSLTHELDDGDALYLTGDIGGTAAAGRTLRFSVSAGQASFSAGTGLPALTLLNLYEQTITVGVSLEVDVATLGGVNLAQAQPGAQLARVTLANISSGTLPLTSLTLSAVDGRGQPAFLGDIFQRLELLSQGTVIATLNSPIPANQDFLFSQNLLPQTKITLEVRGDILAHPLLNQFQVGLAGNQCVNHGAFLSEPPGNSSFPVLTAPFHIRPAELSAVFGNYPNPFRAGREFTNVAYYLKGPATVRLEVFTLSRERIWSWEVPSQAAGLQTTPWDGRNDRGEIVRSGVYLLRITVTYPGGGQDQLTRKISVVR